MKTESSNSPTLDANNAIPERARMVQHCLNAIYYFNWSGHQEDYYKLLESSKRLSSLAGPNPYGVTPETAMKGAIHAFNNKAKFPNRRFLLDESTLRLIPISCNDYRYYDSLYIYAKQTIPKVPTVSIPVTCECAFMDFFKRWWSSL